MLDVVAIALVAGVTLADVIERLVILVLGLDLAVVTAAIRARGLLADDTEAIPARDLLAVVTGAIRARGLLADVTGALHARDRRRADDIEIVAIHARHLLAVEAIRARVPVHRSVATPEDAVKLQTGIGDQSLGRGLVLLVRSATIMTGPLAPAVTKRMK